MWMMQGEKAISCQKLAGGCDSLSCSTHPVQVTTKSLPSFTVAKRPKKSSRSLRACPMSVIPDTEKVARACCWGTPNDAIKKRLDFHAFEDADHGALQGLTAGLPTYCRLAIMSFMRILGLILSARKLLLGCHCAENMHFFVAIVTKLVLH